MCAFILNRTSKRLPEIDIVLFFSEAKKELPTDASIRTLSPVHVNSALTIHKPVPFCMIYRLEEMEKVILHEMMHAYKIDFWWDSGHEAYFRDTFKIGDTGKGIRLSESYNDILACAFMVGIDVFQKMPECSLSNFIKMYERRLHYSKMHIVNVAQRVIAFYGDASVSASPWQEDTHAFSYYVVKALLFLDMPAFTAFLEKQGGFAIGSNRYKIDNYYKFLKSQVVTKEKLASLQNIKNNSLRMLDM
jgi:hypothetical protein